VVKESKHSLRGCLGALIGPWSLALAFGHVHTSYVVYVHGGCIDLVGHLLCRKLNWLKNLSNSEGMLRRFNWSMVFGTCFWPCS